MKCEGQKGRFFQKKGGAASVIHRDGGVEEKKPDSGGTQEGSKSPLITPEKKGNREGKGCTTRGRGQGGGKQKQFMCKETSSNLRSQGGGEPGRGGKKLSKKKGLLW